MEKTYKREVAIVMLLVMWGTGFLAVYYPEYRFLYESLVLPTYSFAGLAFAADAASKQLGLGK